MPNTSDTILDRSTSRLYLHRLSRKISRAHASCATTSTPNLRASSMVSGLGRSHKAMYDGCSQSGMSFCKAMAIFWTGSMSSKFASSLMARVRISSKSQRVAN